MCTGMMARVLEVILSFTCPTSMHQVRGSESTSTGTPPLYSTASAHEIIVKVGMITSSPGLRPRQATAACNATVPLLTAIPYRFPQYAAHRSSNSLMNLPAEEIQPVRTHSDTYSNSALPR